MKGDEAMETQQDATMTMPKAEPQKEHQWLQILVGEWTLEDDKAPGQWTESVRSLHGLWILAEGQGEMPGGGAATTVMTLGYDPQKKRYVGTWIGSMMTHLWIYDGELDATGKILTLNSEGPDMSGEGKMVKYRDVIELKSDDHRVLTSHMLGEDGQWNQFMTAHYRRKK
jgi:hypothetical protein